MIEEKLLNFLYTLPGSSFLLQNKFLFAAAILVVTAVLAKLLLYVYDHYFKVLSKKTKTEVDDIIVELTEKPLFYVLLAFGFKLAIFHLGYQSAGAKIANTVLSFAFIFLLSRILDIIIKAWGATFAKRTRTSIDDVILPLLHKFSKVIFLIISVIWMLDIWGINITPYLAGVGISGIVLGLALQDSLKNVFGGVSLILDKTFRVGDKVKIESGELGVIHDIGLRSTRIRTYANEVIIIPNGELANSRIQNYTKPNAKVRIDVDMGVAYGSDVTHVQKTVLTAIKKIEGVRDDPAPSVNFVGMGDSSLQFKVFVWIDNWQDAYPKKLEVTQVVYESLNKAKINIPFPTRTIYMKK